MNGETHFFRYIFEHHVLTLLIKVPRLDANCAGAFKKQCFEIWPPEVEEMDIDLEEVEFMDSSGIGALIGIYRRLAGAKKKAKILNARPALRTLIHILRLHDIFEVVS